MAEEKKRKKSTKKTSAQVMHNPLVEQMIERYAKGQDIWTGEPLEKLSGFIDDQEEKPAVKTPAKHQQ